MRLIRTVRFGPLRGSCLALMQLALGLPALADDRPWIGMDIVDCRIESNFLGVSVLRIEDGAPAREAGISTGDIVIAMEGLSLSGADDFICRVNVLSPGQRVRLTVLHDGDLLFTIVTLGMWPLDIPQASHSCPVQVSSVAASHSASPG